MILLFGRLSSSLGGFRHRLRMADSASASLGVRCRWMDGWVGGGSEGR